MLRKKLKEKKGFTLMEMLIVVAIIVILVAISIPVFTSQVDKAKTAADEANERAAKSVAVTEYLMEAKTGEYYYNADAGTLATSAGTTEEWKYGQKNKGQCIKVTIDSEGNVKCDWMTPSSDS